MCACVRAQGVMWVIDCGRLNIFDNASLLVNGAPKLFLIDIASKAVRADLLWDHRPGGL